MERHIAFQTSFFLKLKSNDVPYMRSKLLLWRFSVQIIFTTFVMVGVKMLGIRIHLDRDKREPALGPLVYLAFGISCNFAILVGEQSRDISKNQNNGRVAPSRWYRSFVFMSDIHSSGTAALIWSIRND